jgi:hypothetical protein
MQVLFITVSMNYKNLELTDFGFAGEETVKGMMTGDWDILMDGSRGHESFWNSYLAVLNYELN